MTTAEFTNFCGKEKIAFKINNPLMWLVADLMSSVKNKGVQYITPTYKLTEQSSFKEFIQTALHIEKEANR
jgi:hypothetical protein